MCVRIIYNHQEFKSNNFQKTLRKQVANLMVFGKKSGKVEVYYKEGNLIDQFLKEENLLLDTIARELGMFIERKITAERLQRHEKLLSEELISRNRILQTLERIPILSLLNPSLEIPFQEIVKEISSATGFAFVQIELYDELKGLLITKGITTDPLKQSKNETKNSLHETISGNIFRNRRLKIATNGMLRQNFPKDPRLNLDIQTILGVPMSIGDHVIGVITLGHTKAIAPPDHIVPWAKGLANYIASLNELLYASKKLDESEKRFRTIYERSPIGIAIFSANGQLLDANHATLNLFGIYTLNSLKKSKLLNDLGVSDKIKDQLIMGLNVQYEISIDFERIRAQCLLDTRLTGIRQYNVLVTKIYLAREEPEEQFLVQLQDITDQKQIEETRSDLERRRSNFISMTSHELRTPLQVIQGYYDFIKNHFDEITPQLRNKIFNKIGKNINRLNKLVEEVSSLAKIEGGIFEIKRQLLDFHKFLKETVLQSYIDLLEDHLEVHGLHDQALLTVEGDPDRLQQVFDNIISNAIKNTPKENRKIEVTLEVQLNIVRVTITDNGTGIEPNDIERIFEEFVSIPTEYSIDGTGIGLFLARKIVAAHGGTLIAESRGKGFGSSFIIELPRKQVKSSKFNSIYL